MSYLLKSKYPFILEYIGLLYFLSFDVFVLSLIPVLMELAGGFVMERGGGTTANL